MMSNNRGSRHDNSNAPIPRKKDKPCRLNFTWVLDPYVRIMADLIKVVDVDRPGTEAD